MANQKKFEFDANGIASNPNEKLYYALDNLGRKTQLTINTARTTLGWVAGATVVLYNGSKKTVNCEDSNKLFDYEIQSAVAAYQAINKHIKDKRVLKNLHDQVLLSRQISLF